MKHPNAAQRNGFQQPSCIVGLYDYDKTWLIYFKVYFSITNIMLMDPIHCDLFSSFLIFDVNLVLHSK